MRLIGLISIICSLHFSIWKSCNVLGPFLLSFSISICLEWMQISKVKKIELVSMKKIQLTKCLLFLSKQWIKGKFNKLYLRSELNIVYYTLENKHFSNVKSAPSTCPYRVVQWPKPCFSSWLLFLTFFESDLKFKVQESLQMFSSNTTHTNQL